MDLSNMGLHFTAHHVRLLDFMCRHRLSLLADVNGKEVCQRIISYCMRTSPSPCYDPGLEMDELLYFCPIAYQIQSPMRFESTTHISCIQRQALVMRCVVPDRWKEVYIVSRSLIERFVADGFPVSKVNSLARLSLLVRVFLSPPGEYGHDYQWGQHAYGQLQQVIPWLQIANAKVRPHKYFASYGDINFHLFRKLRAAPRNVSGCLVKLTNYEGTQNKDEKQQCDDVKDDIDHAPVNMSKKEEPFVEPTSNLWRQDSVSALNVYSQRKKLVVKEIESYSIDSNGKLTWWSVMAVLIGDDEVRKVGYGPSKKVAKQRACDSLLQFLIKTRDNT